jgi:hypothetical protein
MRLRLQGKECSIPMHVWAEDNPHSIHCRGYQHKFLINIWCGIVGNYLIGPFVLPDRLTGAVYTHFLENDLRNGVEPVDIQLRHEMWFMHDGGPAHFSRQVRAFLDVTNPDRWIGRNRPIPWSARSPDLNPLDYFMGSPESHGVRNSSQSSGGVTTTRNCSM